jgi:hypothetical protein
MRIKLRNGKPASAVSILQVEAAIGRPLSDAFRSFVLSHDGARPETNILKISDNSDLGVSEFIPVNQILDARARIENIPDGAYPVAWAEGGNFIFVNEDKAGAVFFWDHELPDNSAQVANTFGEFLDLLEPFDIKSVRLKPGQVKKVWVDPDFLKKLK